MFSIETDTSSPSLSGPTPAGIGPLVHGDRVSVAIQGIGALTNPVVDRD